MSRLSIILPHEGNEVQFELTLASVLRYRPEDAQIIVPHDGAYIDPYHLRGEVDFVSTERKPHVARALNTGLEFAEGEFVCLIRPGMALYDGWERPIERAFAKKKTATVSPAINSSEKPCRIVTGGVKTDSGFRRRLVGTGIRKGKALKHLPLGPTSFAAFYRRSALALIGKIDERMDSHYVDLDVALSLKKLGFKCSYEPSCMFTVDREPRITRETTLPHGTSAQRAFSRYRNDSTLGTLVSNVVTEIVRSPFNPWYFQQAMGRLNAKRLGALDEKFASQLANKVREMKLASETENNFQRLTSKAA